MAMRKVRTGARSRGFVLHIDPDREPDRVRQAFEKRGHFQHENTDAALDPDVADLAASDPVLTVFDQEHAVT